MKSPELAAKLAARDVAGARNSLRRLRATGTPTLDLAETVCEFADECIKAGDTAAADGVLFHAVHDGVPAHELFMAAKAIGGK